MTLMHGEMFKALRSVLPEDKAMQIAVVFHEALIEERNRHAGGVARLGFHTTGAQAELVNPKYGVFIWLGSLWSAKGVMRVLVLITFVNVLLTCALVFEALFG